MKRRACLLLLASAVATKAAVAQTIMVQPGQSQALNISGESGVTYRCASPGACTLGSGTRITNSSGVTLDGFKFQGGQIAVTITGSSGINVRNSTFNEQNGTGILVNGSNRDITLSGNTFTNTKTGCQYGTNNCTGHLANGSPVASMDYGVRVHGGSNIIIDNNTFAGLFNHSISLKEGTTSAEILNNLFDDCGRTCIELGQNLTDPTVHYALVRGNTLQGKALRAINVGNIIGYDLEGNSISTTGQGVNDMGTGFSDGGDGVTSEPRPPRPPPETPAR